MNPARVQALLHSPFSKHVQLAVGWLGLVLIPLMPVIIVWLFGVPK